MSQAPAAPERSGEAKEGEPAYPASPLIGEGRRAAELDPEQEREAARLERRMKRFLSDLEYSPGQREPPQQVVGPIPPPWTPHPGMATLPEPVIEDVSPRAAAEGAYVRIRGRNLRASVVMFGDQPAQIVSDADDEVTVLAPPGGHGAVAIGVTNVDGTYAIVPEAFTYRP
jgi:hypothetical protein